MDRSQRRDQRRRAPGRQRRSDRSVVRKGRKLMRFKLTPYAQNSLALTHPDLVHFPSPANHRVGAIDEYDVRLSHDLEAPSPDHALEQCWELYQNIDSNYHTPDNLRSEEHTAELQSLMRLTYAVFCLKKKQTTHI